jgi:hypothetical protein
MIGYETYKLIHLLAIFTLFAVAGGAAVHSANRGLKQDNAARGAVAALHGLALLFVLVGGFGMLARLGIKHDWLFPGWLWVKLVIWTLFTFAITLPYRKPALAKSLLFILPLLGGVAAYMVLFKPF